MDLTCDYTDACRRITLNFTATRRQQRLHTVPKFKGLRTYWIKWYPKLHMGLSTFKIYYLSSEEHKQLQSKSTSLSILKSYPNLATFVYLWCLNNCSGVNKSVTHTLTALWQIQQMLIIHPSVVHWIRPDLRLLAGGISRYWRRKTGVSPCNRLTPFILVPAFFTEHRQLTWQLRIPCLRHRAAHVEQLHWLKSPFVGESVGPLLPCIYLFYFWERERERLNCLATDFYWHVRGVIYWPSHVGNIRL